MQEQIREEVEVNSLEWSQVDYQLQLTTGKSSIKIINMFRLESNSEVTAQMDSRNKMDAIVQITDFSKQYAQRVIQKTIPLRDVIFYCGHINIHKYSQQPTKIFTFLICKVSLAKIGVFDPQSPNKCDSQYIKPDDPDFAFQYNYFLKSYHQYQPKYQVSFTVTDDKDFKMNDYQCSNCENKIPALYCKTEKLYFCDECSRDHHKGRLMQNHELQKLDKINTLPLCTNHNLKNEFYCLKCQKYLCLACTQKGVHHQNHQHPIKPIHFLYQEKKQNVEIQPRRHRQKIENLLTSLESKKHQVVTNYNQVKHFIITQYQKSLHSLEELMNEKIGILNSYQIQLRMLNQRLQWSKAFIKFQQKSLKPIYFFQSEQKFEQELAKIKINDFEGIFTTKADIAAEGQFLVARKDVLDRSRKKANNVSSFEPTNQSRSQQKNYSYQKSIYEYDSSNQAPKKGELSLMLENSNLHFFQITPK